jgi:membrane protein
MGPRGLQTVWLPGEQAVADSEVVIMRAPAILRMFGTALRAWWDDNALRLGASLAYYTLFAIAPILLIATAIAGMVFGAEAVRGEIVGQLDHLVGREGGHAVQSLLEGASQRQAGVLATVIGSITFIVAATGAFLELQGALNTIWRVKANPGANLRAFLMDRLRSLGLVVAIGFLLMVSLAVTAALAALSGWLARRSPNIPLVWSAVNVLVSLVVTTALFALLFRFLPDVQLRWRDVTTGAFVTGVLFTIGQQLIGLYLGQSSVASSYGAAGSVMILLLWVYYSCQIFLLGAEFTRVYAQRQNATLRPESFAEDNLDALSGADMRKQVGAAINRRASARLDHVSRFADRNPPLRIGNGHPFQAERTNHDG